MTRTLAAALAALSIAACGGSSSPTAPSPMTAGPSAAGAATIAGRVAGAGSAQLFSSNGAGAGLTVSIVGTNLSSGVDSLGQFTFTNVPAGTTIVLRFEGAGANAQLPLGSLDAGETLTIIVTVTGTTATVDSQAVSDGSEIEIEGRIESIQPALIIVSGRNVTVTPTTTIRNGGTVLTFDTLAVDMRVHVKGTPSGTDPLAPATAREIIVQNTNTDVPVNLDGIVTDLTGDEPAFEFTLDDRLVKGDAATTFKGGKAPQFSQLANGREVHVKGQLREGYVYADMIVLEDNDGGLIPGSAFTGSGPAGGVKGTCPVVAFVVKGVEVTTNAATTFTGVTCATLTSGTKITVTGIVQDDQSVIASSIARD